MLALALEAVSPAADRVHDRDIRSGSLLFVASCVAVVALSFVNPEKAAWGFALNAVSPLLRRLVRRRSSAVV